MSTTDDQQRAPWDSGPVNHEAPVDERPRLLPPAEPEAHRSVKTFSMAVKKAPTLIDFALEFTHEGDEEATETHEFRAIKDATASGMLAISALVRWDQQAGKREYDMNAMLPFFSAVLVDGDIDRLLGLIARKDLLIEMDQIGDVFSWLVEEITGRPTQQSSGSPNRQQRRGGGSTEVQSWRG